MSILIGPGNIGFSRFSVRSFFCVLALRDDCKSSREIGPGRRGVVVLGTGFQSGLSSVWGICKPSGFTGPGKCEGLIAVLGRSGPGVGLKVVSPGSGTTSVVDRIVSQN